MRSKYLYNAQLITEVLDLVLAFAHYCQMLIMHGISFTFVDAVLFLNMRNVFNRLRQKIKAHLNYKKFVLTLSSEFATVRKDEFDSGAYDPICLICREDMEQGKKLSCSHVFHEYCILSWLEKQNTCPTCREPVSVSLVNSEQQNNNQQQPQQQPDDDHTRPVIINQRRGLFMGWIPRVEIRTHPFEVTDQMVCF